MLPATSFFVGLPYANARRLLDAGARVALASDFNPGTAPAMDLQLTHMLAASQMKMSAAEILCASTFNAAAALGLEKTHGVIAPGASATCCSSIYHLWVIRSLRWRRSSFRGELPCMSSAAGAWRSGPTPSRPAHLFIGPPGTSLNENPNGIFVPQHDAWSRACDRRKRSSLRFPPATPPRPRLQTLRNPARSNPRVIGRSG